jgi:protein O-GlcNAc transferase
MITDEQTKSAWTKRLQTALEHANKANFDIFLSTCQQVVDEQANNIEAVLSVGALLSGFGFLTDAKKCFLHARTLAPDDLRAMVNLANLARDAGEHSEATRLYSILLERLPQNAVVRRNILVGSQYDPNISDIERLTQAKDWGQWAISRAGGFRQRPPMSPLENRPLRVGYVSADFCQHTVGLFVKDVLLAHKRVTLFAYGAGSVKDWVTATIQACCAFRDVSALGDEALAKQIQEDKIDVLVDLSGHTAGSRLSVFAHRPAPVALSWLGYFATTGLSYIDAVLLDEWHAPLGCETLFVEPIVRLPMGRLCYRPVPFAPDVSPLPSLSKGFVTFGCFNNSAKLNAEVYDVWAKILNAIPDSRLVLKWRTFADAALRQNIHDEFARRGVDPARIELRGASFHVDALREYADIDIALDPFSFTGGLTSCEALWMGAPVVTYPKESVVSRQTFAFLSSIGLSELAAKDDDDYVRIAVQLATHSKRLVKLRDKMRARMNASALMDTAGFTQGLEDIFYKLYGQIYENEAIL